MQQTGRLFEYRRGEWESIQAFWAKFDLLLSHLAGSSTCLSDELLVTRPLRAVNLSYGQRTSLMSLLDSRSFPQTVSNLRLCSIQLIGLHKAFRKKEKDLRKALSVTSGGIMDSNNIQCVEEQPNVLVVKKGSVTGLDWKTKLYGAPTQRCASKTLR